MDFTIKTYKQLLDTLMQMGYSFQTFQEFREQPKEKSIVLRHDVDKLPANSLRFAQIQHKLGIKGSYYFRIVKDIFKKPRNSVSWQVEDYLKKFKDESY